MRALRLAVFSESSADEAAIRILVEAILQTETQPVGLPPLRSRGWPSTLHSVSNIIKHLHYRTDAEALVVVADSDKFRFIFQVTTKSAVETKSVAFAKCIK